MRTRRVAHVRRAAAALEEAGATLVAGQSAHVPQGPSGRTLCDLGDFIDDYSVDSRLRSDLGLLWLTTLDAGGLLQIEGVPLKLEVGRAARGRSARLLPALTPVSRWAVERQHDFPTAQPAYDAHRRTAQTALNAHPH
jgi:hypothetical protein